MIIYYSEQQYFFTIINQGQMKKGIFRHPSQPTVRILLVAPHIYQVSLFNIKGYLKNLLLDRCKKVGAIYRHFQHSYFVDSTKLFELKKELEDLVHLPNQDPELKFKIEDFPMMSIKLIMKNDKINNLKGISNNRVIFIDRFSQNRYFYAKKRVQEILQSPQKDQASKQPKIILILTSEINKNSWTSTVLKNNDKLKVKQQALIGKENHQLIELTFSELTSRKPQSNQVARKFNIQNPNEPNKVYLITYDNLKFVEGSWFYTEVQKAKIFFTDDAEFLISIESELATLESKKRNFEAYKHFLQNYSLEKELIVFFSKVPSPSDIQNLLVLAKPKNFTGIRTPNPCLDYFNDKKLKSEQRKMIQDFSSWFKKRYRVENRCFKEIYYLLSNVVMKQLDQNVFKKTLNISPLLELSTTISQNYQVHLFESPSELIDKFKTMDKKYKKQYPTINLRQILQALHDKQKSEQKKFQIANKLDDHLMNKNSKHYFFQARQLMIISKIEAVLRRLFFAVNVQKERIVIVFQDEKFEKRLKKYLKETQIEYVQYSLTSQRQKIGDCELPLQKKSTLISQSNYQFDLKSDISVCIVNIAHVFKVYCSFIKEKKKMAENQYQDHFYVDNSNGQIQNLILFPKITSAGSVHFVDTFWYEFNFQKELLLSKIFDFQLTFIDQVKQHSSSIFKQVLRKPQPTSNFYLFQGSYEKIMLQKYLKRKQQLQSFKQQPIQSQGSILSAFVNQMISTQILKFDHLNCQVLDYLDIDEEFDKIEEEAKRLNILKGPQVMEEKVFLPKFTNPENKSFKQMIEQRLNLKNIDQILDESDDDLKQKAQTMTEPLNDIKKQKKPLDSFQNKVFNNQHEVNASNHSQVILSPLDQSIKVHNKQNEDSVFDYLLPIYPQIMPETIRLQSKHFDEVLQTQSAQFFESYSVNQPSKDLFDQLLAPNIDFHQFSCQKYIDSKQPEPQEEAETEPECNDEKNFRRLKKTSQTQSKIQPKFDDSLLFQNFGYMIYHKKNAIFPQKLTQINVKAQDHAQKLQISQNLLKTLKKEQNSIEIINTDEVIDVEKISEIKAKKNFGFSKPRINLKQMIRQQVVSLPFSEVPKGKRLSGKIFYQEAISKSKRLWEKKLRKQKETIILGPKKFELPMLTKPNWREQLMEEEKKKLQEKGMI